MRLPEVRYGSGRRKVTQLKFAGLEATVGGGEGSLFDMKNMTGDHYPVLATREKRVLLTTVTEPKALFAAGSGLCYIGDGGFYVDGDRKGDVSPEHEDAPRSMARLGNYLVLMPDKKYYAMPREEQEEAFGDMEAGWTGGSLTFQNGTIYGEDAKANTIYAAGVDWASIFREGDGVTISGCETHPENNKTIIVREIDGAYLRFYENSFVLDGVDKTTDYTESGTGLKIRRSLPDLKYIFEHENRLWGTDGETVFASKQGDIFNWNVFDGLGSDSWAWTPGSEGEFTGCCSYRGYPVFFKEDYIYKVYGSLPTNYEVLGSATMGLTEGCHGSLAVAGETLFYLGRTGVTAYQGGIPQSIAQSFGTERFRSAVAGSDGIKYYVSMENEEGRWRLYVYDTRTGMWHIEDDTHAVGFARSEGVLYFLTDDGELLATREVDANGYAMPEEDVNWAAEFGDIAEDEPNKKGVSKLQIRIQLEACAWAQVYIQYDSSGVWLPVGKTITSDRKRSAAIPIIPRRCDHYRVKLMGCGKCYIHSMAREYYVGSER